MIYDKENCNKFVPNCRMEKRCIVLFSVAFDGRLHHTLYDMLYMHPNSFAYMNVCASFKLSEIPSQKWTQQSLVCQAFSLPRHVWQNCIRIYRASHECMAMLKCACASIFLIMFAVRFAVTKMAERLRIMTSPISIGTLRKLAFHTHTYPTTAQYHMNTNTSKVNT